MKTRYARFLLLTSMPILFVATPFALLSLGFNIVSSMAFTILTIGLFSDLFSTKAAVDRGLKETNILYRIVKPRISILCFSLLSTAIGIILGIIILLLISSPFVLLMLGLMSMLGSFGNSVTLSMTSARNVSPHV